MTIIIENLVKGLSPEHERGQFALEEIDRKSRTKASLHHELHGPVV
jgi:hypothetical protein